MTMATARDRVLTTVDTLNELGQRSRATLADRVRRVRVALLFAAQAGVAAGLSWLIAFDWLHHPRPFFAPIAAVIALNVSVGQRLRRVVELVVGVALGILVGDVLIYFIGTGGWQIGAGVGAAATASVRGSAPWAPTGTRWPVPGRWPPWRRCSGARGGRSPSTSTRRCTSTTRCATRGYWSGGRSRCCGTARRYRRRSSTRSASSP